MQNRHIWKATAKFICKKQKKKNEKTKGKTIFAGERARITQEPRKSELNEQAVLLISRKETATESKKHRKFNRYKNGSSANESEIYYARHII